jgi:hypothetical protein
VYKIVSEGGKLGGKSRAIPYSVSGEWNSNPKTIILVGGGMEV